MVDEVTDEVFGPATAAWFARAFGTPTRVQAEGWRAIARGDDALLIAPTGSGKTLAAFLVAIDRIGRTGRIGRGGSARGQGARAAADGAADEVEGWRAIYISPLKALVYDVERNLSAPLRGIETVAAQLGLPFGTLRVDVRTGDTSQRDRKRQVDAPGDILVTTPESLYLLLTSEARRNLRTVETLIIDEIHALAPTKRGAHLMLSVERMAALRGDAGLQRIGLSATVRPAEEVARFLSGARACAIVDTASPPRLELEIVVPVDDMTKPWLELALAPGEARASGSLLAIAEEERGEQAGARPRAKKELTPEQRMSLWPAIEPKILELVLEHRSTIVFVNSRGLAERLAQRLNELAEELGVAPAGGLVRAHHGSVAHAQRREIEELLKAGELRAIVATSSLELGIDMGAVELVIQVESPDSSARGLQRVGRAGHQVGGVSRGRIFPKHRNDLLEAAVVSRMMLEGRIEAVSVPKNALDVLAQQIVAMCAMEPWSRKEMLALVRRASSYRELSDEVFDAVLEMLTGRFPSNEAADLRPRLEWDRTEDVLRARKGARLLAVVNGGTIPDRGLYGVFTVGEGGKASRVGELDEEMVHEARVGETFMLGASTWRIQEITRDRVMVTPAPGEPGKMPFWHGDGPGRPIETGRELGAFVRKVGELEADAADRVLAAHYPLDAKARKNLIQHLGDQREATGLLPSDRTIVVERFRDELGDYRVCILTPFGSRVHAPWALAIEETIGRRAGMEVQTLYTDDGIALRFADQSGGTGATGDERAAPGWDALWVEPSEVEELLVERLSTAAIFSSVFRESAARALLLPRKSPDGRAPLWQQRLRAQNLLSAVRQFAGFPIVLETYRTCLQDIFDVPALVGLLQAIERREVRVHEVETRVASPFSRSLAFAYVASYMYEVDNPVAERRAQALSLDRNLLRELLGQDELRSVLSAEVLDEIEAELQGLVPPYQATDADRLHDVLRRVGALPVGEGLVGEAVLARSAGPAREVLGWLDALQRSRRAVRMRVAGVEAWVAVEDVALYRDGLGCVPPSGLPVSLLGPVERPLEGLVAKYARSHGPFSRAEVAAHLGVPEVAIEGAVTALARAGRLSEGAYRPGRSGSELCDTDVLRRIRRRMMAQLRSEVAPVDGAALARFWLGWHGVVAVDEARGRRATSERLLEIVAQLEGFPMPLGELEAVILPARLPGYQPRMLDELMTLGLVVWVGVAAIGSRDGRVALYRRERLSALVEPRSVTTTLLASLEPLQQKLLTHFAARGATFFGEVELGGATRAEALAALWDLVWMGWLTNDTLGPVRALGGASARPSLAATGGRWSLVGSGRALPPTEVALARAGMLFERWGIVARGVLDGEVLPGGFAGLYDTLRAMEEVGRVRRGHFVDGLDGVQMALPGVVDRLRAARSQAEGKVMLVSAIDPASPWGSVLPWPVEGGDEVVGRGVAGGAGGAVRGGARASGVARKAGALVAMEDGVPVFWFGPGGKRLASMPAARGDEAKAVRALMAWARTGREGVTLVTEIDGGGVRGTRWEALLREAGFVGDYRGMVLAKRPEVVARSEVARRFDEALSELRARTGNVAPPVRGAWPAGPWGASRAGGDASDGGAVGDAGDPPAVSDEGAGRDSMDIEGGGDGRGGRVRRFSFRRARGDRPS